MIVRDRTPELFDSLRREPPANPLPGDHPGGQHEPPPTTDFTPLS